MAVRIEFTAPESLVESLDDVRGHEPRASFIKRALESALRVGNAEAGRNATGHVDSASPGLPSPPAPTRTPPRYCQPFIPHAIPPCPDCGKANGVHKGDCPQHPRAGR